MRELSRNFGKLSAFLEGLDDDDIGESTVSVMKAILKDEGKELESELAVLMLSMEQLCKATYILEGGGLVQLLAYDLIKELRDFGD
eukprot:4390300-Pleurochrysis_carterae.AAC.1